jgi:hypothetical protein
LYAEDYSDSTADIVRVNVANGKMERLLSLKEVPRGFDPWEFWVGLAPDDSPLLMRDKSTQEIYSLDVRFPQPGPLNSLSADELGPPARGMKATYQW